MAVSVLKSKKKKEKERNKGRKKKISKSTKIWRKKSLTILLPMKWIYAVTVTITPTKVQETLLLLSSVLKVTLGDETAHVHAEVFSSPILQGSLP